MGFFFGSDYRITANRFLAFTVLTTVMVAISGLSGGYYFIYQSKKENLQTLMQLRNERLLEQIATLHAKQQLNQSSEFSGSLSNQLEPLRPELRTVAQELRGFVAITDVAGEVIFAEGTFAGPEVVKLQRQLHDGNLRGTALGYHYVGRSMLGAEYFLLLGRPTSVIFSQVTSVILRVAGVVAASLLVMYIITYLFALLRIERPVQSLTRLRAALQTVLMQMLYHRRVEIHELSDDEFRYLDEDIRSAVREPIYVLAELVNRQNIFEQFIQRMMVEESIENIYRHLYAGITTLLPVHSFVVLEMNHSLNRFDPVFSVGEICSSSVLDEPSRCVAFKSSTTLSTLPGEEGYCQVAGCSEDRGILMLCVPVVAGGQVLGVCNIRIHEEELARHRERYLLRLSNEQHIGILRDSIASFVRHAGLASNNLKLINAYRNQAVTDTLTGLYNRRYLTEAMTSLVALSRRSEQPISVLMIDIDHFKRFNDEYGHKTGDAVLKIVSNELRRHMRDSDIVGRYGGEEFVVVLPNTQRSEAEMIGKKLCEQVSGLDYSEWQLPGVARITISVGVAEYPEHGYSHYHLINSADRALYQAKESGRNRVTIHQSLPE